MKKRSSPTGKLRRAVVAVAVCGAAGLGGISMTLAQDAVEMDVYKSETCGCCANWIEHMSLADFVSTIHHPADLNAVKLEHGMAPELQSCHTAVTGEGFVFEGHVPAKHVKQFLASPPADALGLAVPGMPMGSPGMEMGNRFTPYDVLLVKKDGSTEVFAHVGEPSQQYE